jgi:hypothetical protein
MLQGAQAIFGMRGLAGLGMAALLSLDAQATTCPQDPPATSIKSAFKGSPNPANAFSGNSAGCRRHGTALLPEHSPFPFANAMPQMLRAPRVTMNSRSEFEVRSYSESSSAAISPEVQSAIESRLDVHWRPTLPGPAWLQNVPPWMIDDAKRYRHRGLPILNLWESSHYLVAVGLSNRGVPGVYFSQKLP